MIRILSATNRQDFLPLFTEMFRARAVVFHDRLGWAVHIRNGLEIDRYDENEDPLYLIAADTAGRATASLRLLPTTGETMLRNDFANFFPEPVDITSPLIWECTRFCVHPKNSQDPRAYRTASNELLIALCALSLKLGIEHIVGLYEARMTRVYSRIGWSPTQLAVSRPEFGNLIVGIWSVSSNAIDRMKDRMRQIDASPPVKRTPHQAVEEADNVAWKWIQSPARLIEGAVSLEEHAHHASCRQRNLSALWSGASSPTDTPCE
jgi:acyl homoserine lactone synthase